MFILAKGGQSYARLRFNTGPGAELVIPVEVDYSMEFPGTDVFAWEREYLANVSLEQSLEIALAWSDRPVNSRNRSMHGVSHGMITLATLTST